MWRWSAVKVPHSWRNFLHELPNSAVAFLLRKFKFILWDIWVAIQLNNVVSLFLFSLYLTLWPLTLDKATFSCLWNHITPGFPKWQTLFSLGRGNTWFPQIVYGNKMRESEDQLYSATLFYPSTLWINIFLGGVTCCPIHKRHIRDYLTRKGNTILEWGCLFSPV